jgi:hypothetical protein
MSDTTSYDRHTHYLQTLIANATDGYRRALARGDVCRAQRYKHELDIYTRRLELWIAARP